MRSSILFLFAIIFLASTPATALYSDSEALGFYFDTGGGINCLETAPYVTVPVYLVLTNPTMDSIYGYEFGYSISGSYMVSGTSLKGTNPIDVGGSPGNHIVGLSSPLTPSGATVLAMLSVFILDDKQIQFELFGADPSSTPDYPELPVLAIDYETLRNPELSSAEGIPNARINGICNPETVEGSWDGVKSLYQ